MFKCAAIFSAFMCLSLAITRDGLKAQEKVTVAYSAISPIMAGVWMAKETGAFERHGLKAELVYVASGSITVQAMIGGDIHMAVAASNAVISAVLRGAPLIAVGSVTNTPAMSLWVRPEVAGAEQLRGKILAITRHGSTTHFLTLAVLEKLGLQGKVKLQPFGGTPEADAAFRAGIVAGRVSSTKPAPDARPLVDLAKLGIPFSMDFMAVKSDFYRSSPKTTEAMVKAYIEGVASLRKKVEAYEVLGKYLRRRSGDFLDEAYAYAINYLEREPKVDPAVVKTVLDWEGKSTVAVEKFFDNSIVDRLAREGFIESLYRGGR